MKKENIKLCELNINGTTVQYERKRNPIHLTLDEKVTDKELMFLEEQIITKFGSEELEFLKGLSRQITHQLYSNENTVDPNNKNEF
ncbi:hypothetical protein AN639_11725 [Candidatus Epulonipiscium fishelsonii]|uniref:Uncharacterized protein n=1 Tax=Candidatus Epulonipiscium fishelsonii TaxID=77094 RepID=A0ACC8XD86_9FIRM|nr:hypothetical protein AN396_05280 [Epulopiscium sp. SCG-B11WGA-EpuloA1]ONI42939.1 hypothetical protein AN639_11725 [Epulopiscium sp. SCG-B05WGA-EpuloA1]